MTESQLAMAKVIDDAPVLILTFVVYQTIAVRDKLGKVVEGSEVRQWHVSCITHPHRTTCSRRCTCWRCGATLPTSTPSWRGR